jgi:hypothetical protein
VKISQPEHGGNGERRCIVNDPRRVVNKWLPRTPLNYGALRIRFALYAKICCSKSSLTADCDFAL